MLWTVCPPEASAQAKVCEFDVTACINQDIVRFDISMNKSHGMNTLYCTCQLSNVKPDN